MTRHENSGSKGGLNQEMKTKILLAKQKVAEKALFVSEQRYRSLLAASNDYVYMVTVDHGRCVATTHGPGCELITGFSPADFALNPWLWFHMIHEDDRRAVVAQVSSLVNGETPSPLEHRIINKNGDLKWIRNASVPQRDLQGRLLSYHGLISDVTERKRTEQLLAVQYAVTRQLAEDITVPEALNRILKAITETFPWDWAAFWNFDGLRQILAWSDIWYSPSAQLQEFEQASRTLRVGSDLILPAHSWASGEPVWIPDVAHSTNFLRPSAAASAGFHGACAIPIRRGKERVGVIELLSGRVEPRDPHMIEMLKALGNQIGQYLDRKWAEDALTTERNLLRTLIDNLPDYVFAKDTSSRFLMNNLAHVRVLGAAHLGEVTGKTDQDFFPAELAQHYLKDDNQVLRSGQALFNREEPVVDPSGRRQWLLTTKVPWKDSKGRIIGLIGISRDITERNQAEEKQRLSEARLQAIIDNSPAVIYLKDIQGRYLLINQQFEDLFHISRVEVIGRTDHDFFPAELADRFRANDEQVIAALAPMEFEEKAPQGDSLHTYISIKFPLVDSLGAAYAVCGISTDISERKRAEEELRKAYTELAQNDANLRRTVEELRKTHEELKETEQQLIQAAKLECIGTLAAGVAHEVKNPLQTMLMGLHYLTQNLSNPDEEMTVAIRDMREAVTRANSIICGLLELAAETKFELTSENLNGCIEHSLWLLRHQFIATQTTVVRHLNSDLPCLQLDRGKIEQALINLFMNSLHAMSAGGIITVSTRVEQCTAELERDEEVFSQFKPGDRLIVLEVQDNGAGIPEPVLPRVFDAFFTTKSAGHGTGLGLAVVKRIVTLHGGAIQIRNAAPAGALVTLILKLQEAGHGKKTHSDRG